MSDDKFISDSKTVLKFIEIYCNDKHKGLAKKQKTLDLNYKEKNLHEKLSYQLCTVCENTFLVSYKNLQSCPHDEKPSCRKCPKPCYERSDWKKVAKIMRYSGMKQGLNKLKKLFALKK